MTASFYTPLERLAKSAKDNGFQNVSADAGTVLRLVEIARAAAKVLSALDRGVEGCIDPTWAGVQNGRGEDIGVELEAGRAALRAALGTQPVKEKNDA